MSVSSLSGSVLVVAQDLFASAVDGEAGGLLEWPAQDLTIAAPVTAWVDIFGGCGVRVAVTAGSSTAQALAAAVLPRGARAASGIDVPGVLGEVVNVIGGNLKGAMAAPAALSIPQFGVFRSPVSPVFEQGLKWHGRGLVISLWDLGDSAGEEIL